VSDEPKAMTVITTHNVMMPTGTEGAYDPQTKRLTWTHELPMLGEFRLVIEEGALYPGSPAGRYLIEQDTPFSGRVVFRKNL
jgi:hypothetical protein